MSHHNENEHANHDWLYVLIWAILLAALGLSMLFPASLPTIVAAIFGIAVIKAFLVIFYFMHLGQESWSLKGVMAMAFLAVGVFLGGIFPDVAGSWSVINAEVAQASHGGGHGGGHGAAAADAGQGEKAEEAPLKEPSAKRGGNVYQTYCKSCHQEDGKGMNGQMAANFVDDKERMSQSNEALMKSIREGKTGKIGTMPPWPSLKDQEVVDVLAYIRETFGSAQ